MIIVLLDEPGLFLFPSPTAAAREIEPVDAETEIRAAYDDAAIPYRVEWVRPNRHRRSFFGLLKSIEPGEYRLVPSGPPSAHALMDLLEAHRHQTQPPEAQEQIVSLLARLRAG